MANPSNKVPVSAQKKTPLSSLSTSSSNTKAVPVKETTQVPNVSSTSPLVASGKVSATSTGSSASSSSSQDSTEIKYERFKFLVPARHDKRFGLGIVNSNGKVQVSTVAPNSIASEIFEVNDHLIAINGAQIMDKGQCKQLILSACSSASDFEIIVDRQMKVTENSKSATETDKAKLNTEREKKRTSTEIDKANNTSSTDRVVEIPDLSFCRPLKKDPENEHGNPHDGFQYAPADVREILQRRIKMIVADFMPPYRQSSRPKCQGKRVNISDGAQLTQIVSDVAEDKQLMKPRK